MQNDRFSKLRNFKTQPLLYVCTLCTQDFSNLLQTIYAANHTEANVIFGALGYFK